MARLPNSERAILDIRKIEDYCLNPEHRAAGTRRGYFANCLAPHGAMADGCEMLCWMGCKITRPLRSRRMPLAAAGASMCRSRDTVGALW